jgi:uncharacterized protein with FMN-binding domain
VTPHVRRTRRNALVLAATAGTVGLLFLFPTSTNRASTPRRPGQALAPAGIVGPTVSGSPSPTAVHAAAVIVVNGTSVDTQYGPVQVQIRVQSKRIVTATAIDYPQGSGRDREINSYAIPVLQRETVQAQSAHIDTVSGATYTSDGYTSSLQSALDLAHL